MADGCRCRVPDFMAEIVADDLASWPARARTSTSAPACRSASVDRQLRDAGRPTPCAARCASARARSCPRVSDLEALAASTVGQGRDRDARGGPRRPDRRAPRHRRPCSRCSRTRVDPEQLAPRSSPRSTTAPSSHAGDDVAVRRLRRRLARQLAGAAPVLGRPRRRRVAGRGRQRHRVRARGPAPLQAAQQGRRRRPGHLPRPRGRCAYRRGSATRGGTARRSASSSTPTTLLRRDHRRPALPRRPQRGAAPRDAAGLPDRNGERRRRAARDAREAAPQRRERSSATTSAASTTRSPTSSTTSSTRSATASTSAVDEAAAVGRPAPREEIPSELAAERTPQLDMLPADLAGQVRSCRSTTSIGRGRAQRFEELMDQLRSQLIQQHASTRCPGRMRR